MSDDGRLEALDRQDCLDLLRTVSVGRLAWSDRDGRVQIRPVNFVLDPGPDPGPDTACVLVRCRDGGMLEAVRHGRPVSFEADQGPLNEWNPSLGTQVGLSEHWEAMAEYGFNFDDVKVFVTAITYRF